MGIRRLFQTRLSVPLYIFPEVKRTVKVFKYCSYCWSLFPGSENWSARLKVKLQRKQTVTTVMAQKTQWMSPGSTLQSSVRCVKTFFFFFNPKLRDLGAGEKPTALCVLLWSWQSRPYLTSASFPLIINAERRQMSWSLTRSHSSPFVISRRQSVVNFSINFTDAF